MKKYKIYIFVSYLLIFFYALITSKISVLSGTNILLLLILSLSKFKLSQALINAITFFSSTFWLLSFINNLNTSNIIWFNYLIDLIWLLTSIKLLGLNHA